MRYSQWLAVAGLAQALLAAPAPAPKVLSIARITLSQFEDGPPVAGGFDFAPGDTIFFSCAVLGFGTTPGDEPKVDLSAQMQALDAQGVPLSEAASKQVQTTLAPEDKEWAPKLRQTFIIPPLIFSGRYRIAVSVEDKITGQKASADVPFQVRGHEVQVSDSLIVRNVRFYRGDQPDVLVQPVYRPGDTLTERFDIVGYKLGPGNQLQIEYGVAVLDAEGKTLYAEPRAAVEADASFYPKRYLPGNLSITLNNKVKPATYTLLLTVKDTIGNQTYETRQDFKVE